jgi:hypothetical protein
MNEALHGPPLRCRVEDGYGKSCGFAWLIGGPILSKLELGPPMSESSPRKVVNDSDVLCKSSFVGYRYASGEHRGFLFLMGDLIVSTTPIFGSPY